MISQYEFFTEQELTCKCCGENHMDELFMRKVVRIRAKLGFPFSVNSAYRCPEHNNNVSSTGLDGPHTTGRALDIKANSRQKALIMRAAAEEGMTRFGIAKSFVHFDDLTGGDGFDESVIWTY